MPFAGFETLTNPLWKMIMGLGGRCALLLLLAAASAMAADVPALNSTAPAPLGTLIDTGAPAAAPPFPVTDDCPDSIYDHGLTLEGSIKFPVFHRKHPCFSVTDKIQADSTIDIPVIEDLTINDFAFLMPIQLGTPPVMNLVLIDTGATLSWVQCKPCFPSCHDQSVEAGEIFDPSKSSTFRRAKCKSRECYTIKYTLGLLFANCMEKEDTCLYSMRYGAGWIYSAGKVVWDNLMFGKDSVIMSMSFLFGCSQAVAANYEDKDAGLFGFGRDSFSFFEQVASHINYKAFSYCLPSDHTVRGYMVLGDYSREGVDTYTPLFPSTHTPTYSLRLAKLVANGQTILVASSSSEMMVDSGALWTILPSDTFHSLDKVITEAMALAPLRYERNRKANIICFDSRNYSLGISPRHPVFSDWSSLPLVEMVFDGAAALRCNLFYNDLKDGLCMYFWLTNSFKSGMLGNRVTRSFETIFDIQGKKFGFKRAAC